MLQRLSALPFPTPLGQSPEDVILYIILSRTHAIQSVSKSRFMVIHKTKVSGKEHFTVEEIDDLPVSLVYTGYPHR